MITEKRTQFLVEELDQLKKNGLFRPLRVLASAQDTEVVVDGKRVLNLSSNNYLGLTTHPRLKRAMVKATEEWGAGSGAVRTIAGTMPIHDALDGRVAWSSLGRAGGGALPRATHAAPFGSGAGRAAPPRPFRVFLTHPAPPFPPRPPPPPGAGAASVAPAERGRGSGSRGKE